MSAKTEYQREGRVGVTLLFIWIFVILCLWGFAFLPTKASPEWLTRTQWVCFGTMPSGLPGPQGWMLLLLGPLALLSFMWGTHASELYAIPTYLRTSRVGFSISIIFIIGLMTEAHFVGRRLTELVRNSQLVFNPTIQNPLPADYPRYDKTVPDFKLVDQNKNIFTNKNLQNKVTILSFTFAHCSTVCPVLIRDTLDAQKILGSDNVTVVFITLDPWRDTPSSLPSLAKSWSLGKNSFMLSGSVNEVTQALKGFNFVTERDLKTGDIVHAAQVMIVDRNGKIAYNFLNPTVDWLVTAIQRVSQ